LARLAQSLGGQLIAVGEGLRDGKASPWACLPVAAALNKLQGEVLHLRREVARFRPAVDDD
jgi:hypothetical protein